MALVFTKHYRIYEEEKMHRTQVHMWFKWFQDGLDDVTDERSGYPTTCDTSDKCEEWKLW